MDTTEYSTESIKYTLKEGCDIGIKPSRLEIALKPARELV